MNDVVREKYKQFDAIVVKFSILNNKVIVYRHLISDTCACCEYSYALYRTE